MRLDKSSQTTFLNAAISHLRCHLLSIGNSDHKTRQEGQAHLDTIWREVESSNLGDHFLEAQITFGNFHQDQGRHRDAEMMYNNALAGYERHWDPSTSPRSTPSTTWGSSTTSKAVSKMMYNRALAGREKALGHEHMSTLHTVNNLGILYRKQGRLKDAEVMYNRALAGYEMALGADHPSTLDIVNNLGVLYRKQGRLRDADVMYNRVLAGKERA